MRAASLCPSQRRSTTSGYKPAPMKQWTMIQALRVVPALTALRWCPWSPTALTTHTMVSSIGFSTRHTCRGSSGCSTPLGTCQSTVQDQASCDGDCTFQDIIKCSTLTCFLAAETAAFFLCLLCHELCSTKRHKQKWIVVCDVDKACLRTQVACLCQEHLHIVPVAAVEKVEATFVIAVTIAKTVLKQAVALCMRARRSSVWLVWCLPCFEGRAPDGSAPAVDYLRLSQVFSSRGHPLKQLYLATTRDIPCRNEKNSAVVIRPVRDCVTLQWQQFLTFLP